MDGPLHASIAELARFISGERTVSEALAEIGQLACEAIPAADMAGMTLVVEGRQRTAIFTDGLVPVVDQVQYDTGEGPCLEAYEEQRVVSLDSTSEDGRWAAFRSTCAAHGIGSTFSLPLGVEDRRLGALNLYARRPHAFREADRAAGGLFAAQASVVLANAQAYWDAHDLGRRLRDAAATRSTIDVAKGIIMATRRCDGDAAFEILVAASQRENRKLRDVAARIVRNTVDPPSA